jgi:hypothetical protein
MARIVAGYARSFSPQLHVAVENWAAMGERDSSSQRVLDPHGRYHSYQEFADAAGPEVKQDMDPGEQAAPHKRVQDHIETLAAGLRPAELDALLIFTDEHRLFADDNFPARYVYYAEDVPYRPAGGQADSIWAYGTEPLDRPGAAELGENIISHRAASEIDVSRANRLPEGNVMGHHTATPASTKRRTASCSRPAWTATSKRWRPCRRSAWLAATGRVVSGPPQSARSRACV